MLAELLCLLCLLCLLMYQCCKGDELYFTSARDDTGVGMTSYSIAVVDMRQVTA